MALFAGVWLATVWTRIGAPLGLNHDGQNAGVFGSSARALVDDPFGSRLGSHLATHHEVYANHPPLVNWLLALAHWLLGDNPAALRLPMVAAAVLLIVATYRLLSALDLSPGAAAIGTIGGLGAPMFFVYGTMADTPMMGLPFGVLLAGQVVRLERGRAGRRALVVIAAMCALAGWEAVLLAVALAIVDAVRVRRGDVVRRAERRTMSVGRPIAAGLGMGLAVTVGWILWAYDGIAMIRRSFLERSGTTAMPFSLAESVAVQLRHLADVYGPILAIALGAGVFAVRVPSVRRHLPVLAGVCLAYQVGFRQGATYHDYWSYWWQLPIAVAIAGAVEVATRTHRRPQRALVLAALVVVACGPLLSLTGRSVVERSYHDGVAIARLIDRTRRPPDQTRLVTLGLGRPNSWASWSTHLEVDQVDLGQLHRLAAEHPRWEVIGYCDAPRSNGGPPICRGLPASTPRARNVVIAPAARLDAAIRAADR